MRLDGKIVQKICTGCENYKVIVYQGGQLCTYCNQKRLIELREERKKERELRSFEQGVKTSIEELKKTYSIKKLSTKGKVQRIKLKAVYKKMDDKARDEGKYYCQSCGSTSRPLSHSHTIAVGQRKDLELDPDNIVLECMDWNGVKGCHTIWEHGTIEQKKKLLTFESKLSYIKRVDPERYQKLING